MKKLMILLLPFICCSCVLRENVREDVKDNQPLEEEYIEKVPSGAKPFIEQIESNKVILTNQEIETYNLTIANKTDHVFDLTSIKTLTKEEISNYIGQYLIPKLPKYNQNVEVSSSVIEEILENRNMDTIKDKRDIEKGIIIRRTNLRAFPTEVHFYDNKTLENFDRIQESELHVNTPVLILHNSKDKKWVFVISHIYMGWIKEEDIAYASVDDWDYFIDNSSFGVITESSFKIEDITLDMGVKLPYLGARDNGYQFIIPVRGKDKKVSKKKIIVSRDKAHIGYLPYTRRNLYIQAFKYEGTDYSWSGMDSGVDCSSYILNVYQTFGFQFPRNTVDQNKSVGKVVSLENKTEEEKLQILRENGVGLLYQKGHAMIYLGVKDEKHYIIHASGSVMKVVLEELNLSSKYLGSIDKLVLISG